MTLRFGHRGACGHAPENTLASVRKALNQSVDGIEIDVRMCKSGELVVMHDETLERTTNGRGFVADHTLAQLKALDAGRGEIIPTLDEVIECIAGRCVLFIEMKEDDVTQAVAKTVARYVGKGWRYDQLVPCSFNHKQIAEIRTLNPSIRTAAINDTVPFDLAVSIARSGAFALSAGIYRLTQAMVDDARRRNLRVYAWTANKPHHIAKARALGVDGIFSDYPDRL